MEVGPLKNGTIAEFEQKESIILKRSEIMQEIVSEKPGVLVSWGYFFFFLVLMVIVVASWFIKYPVIIEAQAKLTSINAPKPVVSQINGELIKLNINDNQVVEKGETLGFIESTANHEEVIQLSSFLDTTQNLLKNNGGEKFLKYSNFKVQQLGELQTSYQIFFQAYLSFQNYLPNGFYIKKKELLQREMERLKDLNNNLKQEKGLQLQDLEIAQKIFDVNEKLKSEKVISDFDFLKEQSKLMNKKLSLPQISSSIINNESLQNEKQKEIMELENTIDQQSVVFQQALNTFKSHLQEWKGKYLLTAPVSGKVAFNSFIQENQQLQANQVICYVNPENSEFYAEIIIPQSNLGKVSIGQEVLLKFPSYPFQEYGSVKGTIASISNVSKDEGYLAKIKFKNGLITTNKQRIQPRDGLKASAEIITKDMRLIERIFSVLQ